MPWLRRRTTSPDGRLPDFLGLGAQKAGTTTLHALLAAHPGAFLPALKEVQYVSLHADRPVAWYRSQFAGAGPDRRAGEFSPYYLFHPWVPGRIAALLPEARLIVLLRDPVERALSGYFHSRRHGLEPLPIEAAFAAEAGRLDGAEAVLRDPAGRHTSHQHHSYLARSRYEVQLARYSGIHAPSRLLVLRSEDLFQDPEPIWRQVLDFLDLAPIPLPAVDRHENRGRGESATVDPTFRARLRDALEPTYEAIARTYGITWP